MAQTLQVLKCFSCNVFQVQIKKKSKRWECKLCGEKQSVTKIYGEGSGKDCRLHVQKLNEMRGMQEEAKRDAVLNLEEDSGEPSWDDVYEEDDYPGYPVPVPTKKSKWSDFLDDDSQDESPENMEGGRKKMSEIIPNSQIQEQNQESFHYSSHETFDVQPFFATCQVNRQQKLHLESDYKYPTSELVEQTLDQDNAAKEAQKKKQISSSTQDFNDGESKSPKNSKYNGLFCVTKNEELDELLKL